MSSERSGAGAAFEQSIDVDPVAREAWERASSHLQTFARILGSVCQELEDDRDQAIRELTDAVREALQVTDRELEASGFEAPCTLEDWEHLAHIAEMPFDTIRSGHFTLADVRTVALAWADRQRMKAKLAAEAGAAAPLGHKDAPDEDEAPLPALTANEAAVLRTLATFDPAELASAARVEAAMDRMEAVSARTVGVVMRRLIELGLAERPEGHRSGARLTIAGRRLVRKIAG